jgi:hypothetical protein
MLSGQPLNHFFLRAEPGFQGAHAFRRLFIQLRERGLHVSQTTEEAREGHNHRNGNRDQD